MLLFFHGIAHICNLFNDTRSILHSQLETRARTSRNIMYEQLAAFMSKGASPNYFFQNNVIVTLKLEPPLPPIMSRLFISQQEMKYEIQDKLSIVWFVFIGKKKEFKKLKHYENKHRRSPLLLTCHYPCVCRNTARWTAHAELLEHGAKQRRYRHFVGRQNVTWLTPSPPNSLPTVM